jgi:DNA-binding protein Alba
LNTATYIYHNSLKQESGSTTVVLKAMGRAINKAVTIAEILKRKMTLHQVNDLASVEMIDVYEPVEEGLDIVTSRRYVSCIKIILSVNLHDAQIDTAHSGYQPPLPDEEMHHQQQQQQSHYSSSSPSPHGSNSPSMEYTTSSAARTPAPGTQ